MAIALKIDGNGRLQQIEVGDSIEADSLERRNSSGNLVVGSGLGAMEELQLGSTTSLVRAMGDAEVDGLLTVTDSGGDTSPLLDLDQTGSSAGRSRVFVGSRNPEGNVSANAGDLYVRDSTSDSTVFVFKGTDATNNGWYDLFNPPIRDFDSTEDTTSGSTYLTKVSISIPAEDATFIIEVSALVSHSNTTGNPSVRLQNTTDASTLGRAWVSEMADSDNVMNASWRYEFTNTVVAGAKTLALQYAVESGLGTMTISDAMITATRVA